MHRFFAVAQNDIAVELFRLEINSADVILISRIRRQALNGAELPITLLSPQKPAPSIRSEDMLCGNPDTPSPQIGRYTSGRQLAFEKYRRAGRIGRTSKMLRLVVLSCSKDK